jgi:23S rRNA (pseudouridine1915-N3)-methyltransferase
MKIKLLCVGKNNQSEWFDSVDDYLKRVNQYTSFTIDYVSEVKTGKKSIPDLIKKEEGKKLLSKIKKEDLVILLDEKGKSFNSLAFAKKIETHQKNSVRNLVFIIGGAFGFSDQIYTSFPNRMRLSDMTFSHQMIRLFFCEQLYRAYSIIHKHPYHNS